MTENQETENTPLPSTPAATVNRNDANAGIARRHIQFGWWSLLAFLTFGLVLESLHGFKIQWYLNVSNETRRLMWTLAHAHGTLLALVHLGFGSTAYVIPRWHSSSRTLASCCLSAASTLIPLGFLLGGAFVREGDPSLGILLVPLGAVLLFVAVLLTARAGRLLVS